MVFYGGYRPEDDDDDDDGDTAAVIRDHYYDHTKTTTAHNVIIIIIYTGDLCTIYTNLRQWWSSPPPPPPCNRELVSLRRYRPVDYGRCTCIILLLLLLLLTPKPTCIVSILYTSKHLSVGLSWGGGERGGAKAYDYSAYKKTWILGITLYYIGTRR